jgi:hypothetical protein
MKITPIREKKLAANYTSLLMVVFATKIIVRRVWSNENVEMLLHWALKLIFFRLVLSKERERYKYKYLGIRTFKFLALSFFAVFRLKVGLQHAVANHEDT